MMSPRGTTLYKARPSASGQVPGLDLGCILIVSELASSHVDRRFSHSEKSLRSNRSPSYFCNCKRACTPPNTSRHGIVIVTVYLYHTRNEMLSNSCARVSPRLSVNEEARCGRSAVNLSILF